LAWIELHQSLWTHRKTFMLAALLGIDETYAGAHMARLWTWALDNTQNGSLQGLPPQVIAFGAGWKGDAEQFVNALKRSGFLDDDMSLHDWYDYAGRLIEKKEANKERARKSRERMKHKSAGVSELCAHVASNKQEECAHVAGLPNLTKPNLTIKEKEIEHAREYLLRLYNDLGIKGGVLGLDKVYSYIGVVDLEVIEMALKAAEKKHVNYFCEVLNGWIAEGKTTAAQINPIPDPPKDRPKTDAKSRGQPVDKELEARRMEIALNQWIASGGDPNDFVYRPDPGG